MSVRCGRSPTRSGRGYRTAARRISQDVARRLALGFESCWPWRASTVGLALRPVHARDAARAGLPAETAAAAETATATETVTCNSNHGAHDVGEVTCSVASQRNGTAAAADVALRVSILFSHSLVSLPCTSSALVLLLVVPLRGSPPPALSRTRPWADRRPRARAVDGRRQRPRSPRAVVVAKPRRQHRGEPSVACSPGASPRDVGVAALKLALADPRLAPGNTCSGSD